MYLRSMEPISAPYAADLFPPLYEELEHLLRGLAPEEWERPTVAGAWRVRDVVAHLLDGDLRKLSAYGDGHLPPPAGGASQAAGATLAPSPAGPVLPRGTAIGHDALARWPEDTRVQLLPRRPFARGDTVVVER